VRGKLLRQLPLSEGDTGKNSFVERLVEQRDTSKVIQLPDPNEPMKGRLSKVKNHIAEVPLNAGQPADTQFRHELTDKCLDFLLEEEEDILTPELTLRLWALISGKNIFSDLPTLMEMLRTREDHKRWQQSSKDRHVGWEAKAVKFTAEGMNFAEKIMQGALGFS